MSVELHHGDCLEVLRAMPDNSVDSVCTDPPYSLGFMGREWDSHKTPFGFQQWCELWATECLRVLKPGGHLLAFGGTRTSHRLACAIEDAGFEIRDSIAWLYGSGFPKSLDVSKAIDKAAGAERTEVIGRNPGYRPNSGNATGMYEGQKEGRGTFVLPDITAPATDAARTWQGWGTALKPAHEPIVVARKPPAGTVAANVLQHGTGALNVDGCRVEATDKAKFPAGIVGQRPALYGHGKGIHADRVRSDDTHPTGRWPANVVLDESQAAVLDEQSGNLSSGGPSKRDYDYTGPRDNKVYGAMQNVTVKGYPGKGGASRFFYVAKAPKSERPTVDGIAHPTVKPLALMRWLVRLVTPPGGVVLEPFAGSGTTVEAALLEGFRVIAIEREADYLPLIEARIARVAARAAQVEPDLFTEDTKPPGRWPPNVAMDRSQAEVLDEQTGELPTQKTRTSSGTGDAPGTLGFESGRSHSPAYLGEKGGASRFFPIFDDNTDDEGDAA